MAAKFPLIVLASSSQFRKKQLEQLNLPFISISPKVDETPLSNEIPRDLALRLSKEKALSLQQEYHNHVIIGADQTAEIEGQTLGKPLTLENAVKQLRLCQGKEVIFYSGVCVLDSAKNKVTVDTVETRVRFRDLSTQQIQHYVTTDQPLYCAGSFKCESLGISLFSKIESIDPSALVGLPLIRLNQMLFDAGIDVLSNT